MKMTVFIGGIYMKKITKICVLMATFLAAIGMTGCPNSPIGKDDFFGYWRTTDFDADGNRLDYYQTSSGFYQIDWDFNGVSENMFKDGGTFKQHLKRASSLANLRNGTYDNETFWTGKYQLKGNSGYSYGVLVLYYEYGAQLNNRGNTVTKADYTYNEVKDFSEADFLSVWKDGNKNSSATVQDLLKDPALTDSDPIDNDDGTSGVSRNGITVQKRIKNNKTEYGDIEYFRFRLEDGVGFKGYARMLATTVDRDGQTPIGGIYNQWKKLNTPIGDTSVDDKLGKESSKYGWKNNSNCSWNGTNFRALALMDKSSGEWVSNDSRTNEQLFKIHKNNSGEFDSIADDANDPTNYRIEQ